MGHRLTGMLMTAWFFVAMASLFIAGALSPMGLRLLLADTHPVSWIYPALLISPPLVLLGQRALEPRISRPLAWVLTIILAMFAFLLFVFLAATFLGSPI